jgi:hypothetical protein
VRREDLLFGPLRQMSGKWSGSHRRDKRFKDEHSRQDA